MSNSTTTGGTTSGTGPTSNTISSIISSLSSSSSSSQQQTTTPDSSTSSPPSTTEPPTSTTPETSSVDVATSVRVISNSGVDTTITSRVTRTLAPTAVSPTSATTSSAGAGGSLQGNSASGGSSKVSAGTVVPAVVVPVVVIALLILGAVFFFRRRKAKEAEELRRKEVEEYGFNPNADTGFTAAGLGGTTAAATATDDNAAAMSEVDGSGYRGWGTTATARKASTTLGSASAAGTGAIGVARSDSGGNGEYRGAGGHSPNGPSGSYSDHNSGDPLVTGGSRPISQDFEGVAALGSGPAAGSRAPAGVHRGPSNASSAYSNGQRSDTSGEGVHAIGSPTWANDYLPEDGPYGPQNGGAPVIRDVSARRNTRIEQPSVMPQQGRGGISQNF